MRATTERRAIVIGIAVSTTLLAGCSDEQFRELMLTIAFGLLVVMIGTVLMSLINLIVLGGGIASLAINLLGTPTHRSRTYGFVFGGLNIATGLSGLLATISGAFVFHDQIVSALTPTAADGTLQPAPDLFFAALVSVALSSGTLALGLACIAVAARAKAVDLVPREQARAADPAS